MRRVTVSLAQPLAPEIPRVLKKCSIPRFLIQLRNTLFLYSDQVTADVLGADLVKGFGSSSPQVSATLSSDNNSGHSMHGTFSIR